MSRYIDAEWLIKNFKRGKEYKGEYVLDDLKYDAPSIDIVRCKKCKHHEDFPTGISPLTCSLVWGGVFENDFCSYGVQIDECEKEYRELGLYELRELRQAEERSRR